MYGSTRYEEHDYDYSCPHCGAGFYADVGMGPLNCSRCGESLSKPSPPPQPIPDDDALLDPRFVLFDEYKAFKFLRRKGLLHIFMRK